MMRGDRNPADVRELLSRRSDALALLVEAAYEKAELTDELGVSRSTVDRAVRSLEANGLVRRRNGAVTATLAGRLAHDAYRRYCAETDHVARAGDLLSVLPPSVNVGHALLEDAEIYRSEPPATGRPSNAVTALIAEGTRLRACAQVINDSSAADQFHRMVTERGGEGAVIYTSSLVDLIATEYFGMHNEMAETGRFEAHEIDDLPYELFLVDDADETTVVVAVYDDAGSLRGAIFNDTEAAVSWGEETFERYRAAATEITDEFVLGE
jgi:predicted transcriptional regulator